MEQAKITSKGQITIPKKIREQLDLHPGDRVLFEVDEDGSVKIHHTKKSLLERAGALHEYAGEKPVSIEEMNEAIKEASIKRYKKTYDRN